MKCKIQCVQKDIELSKDFECEIIFFSLSINFNMCFGCSKESSNRDVVLSTHSICFG